MSLRFNVIYEQPFGVTPILVLPSRVSFTVSVSSGSVDLYTKVYLFVLLFVAFLFEEDS